MKETAFRNPSVFSTEKVSDSYVIYKKMLHKVSDIDSSADDGHSAAPKLA